MARPRNGLDIDAVLLGDLPYDRRGARPQPLLDAGSRRGAGRHFAHLGRRHGDRSRAGSRRRNWPRGWFRLRRRGGHRRDGRSRPERDATLGVDIREDGSDLHRLALGHRDLHQGARSRGRDLRIYLVRRDLQDRLVALDRVACLLEPLGDSALGDGLTHLGHRDFDSSHPRSLRVTRFSMLQGTAPP